MINIKELPESTKDRITDEIYIRDNIKVKWTGKNIEKRVCQFENCKKRCCYNFEGLEPKYCTNHKKENMVDVKSRMCKTCNKKRPIYNYPQQKKGLYCKDCKLDDMINVKDKKCSICKEKIPNFNFPGLKAEYCENCSKDGMVNVKIKKCISCKIVAAGFNYPGEKSQLYCSTCKLDGMVNLFENRICKNKDCNKSSSFGYRKDNIRLYCYDHKKDDMIDLANQNKICNSEWCNTRVLNKYKGYCLFCFINLFPDEKVCRNYKTKEKSVADFILENFPNFTWICDKQIQDGCSRKRPDLLLDLGYQVIIIEIDEEQHINYNCENKRIMEISKDLDHRPTIFLRFNPDEYLCENKKITSPWGLNNNGILIIKKSKQKEWNSRLEKLKETVEFWIKEKNKTSKMIEIQELFFDC
jgi:hypothetical protein